jgi:hypothetical protein
MMMAMKRIRYNDIRAVRSRVFPGRGLLVWLLCLTLAVAAMPSYLSATAQHVDPGGDALGLATFSTNARVAPGLRAPRCDIGDPHSSAKAIRVSRSRGGKLAAKRYPRAGALIAAASPTGPPIVGDHPLRGSFTGPLAHSPSSHSGRAPPAATHKHCL